MRILLIGSGGREHALAWKLAQSPRCTDLLMTPGNAGTASLGENLAVAAEDLVGLLNLAQDRDVDLTVVGPEAPLVAGLADRFEEAGLNVFGPTAAAAQIEGSKAWANDLMGKYGIPTGQSRTFSRTVDAIEYSRSEPPGAFVVKADGLAAGKGVIVPESYGDSDAAIRSMLEERVFGDAGGTVLLEERLRGIEVSVFAFLDGETVSAEVAACDYKRINDGDEGPNTGGVGCYTPPEFWTSHLASKVRTEILEPTAKAMVEEGCPYRGVLYAGIMVTDDGPKVFEFNCRFGDPECEVLMPLLDSDLVDVCFATAEGRLASTNVVWRSSALTGVVMCSAGYPTAYETGFPITGIDSASNHGLVFQAGTASGEHDQTLTAGGRVLIAVGEGADISSARAAAYRAVDSIQFEGAHYRTDIALRAVPG